MPDGSLVVDVMERNPEGKQHLAKIGRSGATEMTGVLPAHGPHEPLVFVDDDGVAHLIRGGPVHGYAQVDLAAKGLPVVRYLDYSKPFNGLVSAPAYLRWEPYVSLVSLAFHSEGRRQVLAATLTRDDSLSNYHFYRVNTKSLSLIGSGAVHRITDVYRRWTGPTIPRAVLVPAAGSGYWLFVPTNDTPPLPTVAVYRICPDLRVVSPAVNEMSAVQPLSAAPRGAVVVVRTLFDHRGSREKLKLEFIALAADGRLCTQTFEDSVSSRVTG